ncbi:MAG: DNA-directed RNA polymerase subunit beta' [Proteobacteria bacterium]|nr:DNA-directed RNA polymerase subunit beta' [Pseudomonadota bacterium]
MTDIYSNSFDRPKDPTSFSAMRISLASPQKIREWSHGEVKKPETINYRTFKPERDGLFCAKIFGPVKDYECNCGKYKRMKHRGVVCEKCGVEVIQSKVRRERLGHINLATPVAHIWFLKSLPSRIGNILDIPLKELEKVLYCVSFIVTNPGSTPLEKGEILSEKAYSQYLEEYKEGAFEAKMGAEAIHDLLEQIDIEMESMKLRHEMKEATSDTKRKKIAKRLKVIEAFRNSDNLPEWMILEVLPVIPPDLRPLVPLDGGRFATSDLNDLYRRVINRNNRLRRLIELNAPEIIVRNEKRMLQEAVDALFDNGRRGKTIHGPNKRPLKSLSDMLKGKHGRFRQNLLGKRVDYSGRSVIVVGPELRLHQCGLPKKMALELFKPFIFNKLVSRGIVNTIKSAKKMVEIERPEVWDILDEVIKEHPVLLNRAPTLHRLGIQAFEPTLIEGKAIQMHPLVCTAFNADFDGDQMAVHVPLSLEAQMEARVLLLSTNNILSPASGTPIIGPTQDMVLGCYYLTRERPFAQGCYREDEHGNPIDGLYANFKEVTMAYDNGKVHLQAAIKVRKDGQIIDTTVGRVLLYEILPREMTFDMVNRTLNKKALANLIDLAYRYAGDKGTVLLADRVRTIGYNQATKAGVSINIHDMVIPKSKATLLAAAQTRVNEITDQYNEGLITDKERYNKVVDIWSQVTTKISDEMMHNIKTQTFVDPVTGKTQDGPSFNAVFMMADSGARGSQQQIRQIAGMRGLMAKPSGEIIETPIRANFREGLSVLQYFISTHGARKGLADTALKTANSGYLTRRLVDVSQDTIIFEQDCGTLDGIEMTSLVKDGEVIEDLGDRVLGRVALFDIVDNNGAVIVPANGEIDEAAVDAVRHAALRSVYIRSGLTCQAKHGVCALCYGRDLARGRLVNHGEAVGVIAAQSIGEPGTQLTMRTFHTGGTANVEGVESSYEARNNGFVKFHMLSCVDALDGTFVVMNRSSEISIHDSDGRERERYPLRYGARLRVKDGQNVVKGQVLAEWDAFANVMISQEGGIVKFEHIIENRTMREEYDKTTGLSRKAIIETKEADLLPRIIVRDKSNSKKILAEYQMPVDAILIVSDGDEIGPGQILAKIPHDDTKSGGIVGGLPRVAELFEARKPKELAIISEIEGYVSYGKDLKGKRRIIITPDVGEAIEYLIPKGKYIIVHPGDRVQAGDQLMEGSSNPHDILAVKGRKDLAKYMVDEIQEIYRTQGVRINDKHIEVIVRQMLRRCKITHVGDTNFLLDEHVDRQLFEAVNAKVIEKGGEPAIAEDLLLGITKASLSTDSFIAASAFQETTKVLTEASISGRYDGFHGLKENVIMGRLIPAGTGLQAYNYLDMVIDKPED